MPRLIFRSAFCVLCSVFCVLLLSAAQSAEPPPHSTSPSLLRLRAALHVDTSISHGRRTVSFAGLPLWTSPGEQPRRIEDIARIAREQGVDVILVADRARADISYGLTPFSRLFRVTVSEGSIASCGAAEYLDRLRNTEAASGVLIIPGAECMPYYQWRGNVFSGLRLSHAYEHVLLAGLDTPAALEHIPPTAGGWGLRFSWTVLLNFAFAALLALGLRLASRPIRRRRLLGAILIVISLLALIDSAPFLPAEISPYEQPRENPADLVASYAEAQGALMFWAHPSPTPGSLPHRLRQKTGVTVDVADYSGRLLTTARYTGFAMFNAGEPPGRAGGEWDGALRLYCAGERGSPVWAVSESDFDEDSPPDGLPDAQTVLWVTARTKSAVLDALRSGRCYATKEHTFRDLRVIDYALTDGTRTARSGERLDAGVNPVTLKLSIEVSPRPRDRVPAAQVVVDGIVAGEFEFAGAGEIRAGEGKSFWQPCAASGPIRLDPSKKLSYLRVLLRDNSGPTVALNPIFISRAEGHAR